MAIDIPKDSLSRTPQSDADLGYPDHVEICLVYGMKTRTYIIQSDEFFGRGGIGAPISGDAVIAHINRLRRMGRPE